MREALISAARVIHRTVKLWLARRAMRVALEFLHRNRAATTIQQFVRSCICRQRERSRRMFAAITLQRAVGKFLVLGAHAKKRRDEARAAAAVNIQAEYRGFRVRATTSVFLRKRANAAVEIQRLVRTRKHENNILFCDKRKRSFAVTLQCAWRRKMACEGRRKLELELGREEDQERTFLLQRSASTIERAWKRHKLAKARADSALFAIMQAASTAVVFAAGDITKDSSY